MATLSSIAITQIQAKKHDVFLTFRGEDVRSNFVSFLHQALHRGAIKTFIDYELQRGEEISPALLQAIEESSISIIVFSKKYASSTWCLDELLKILECRNVNGQIVVPIFYHVDPADVRNQVESYAEAFTKHEQTLMDKKHKIQEWKNALTEAANLAGWALLDDRPESIFIEEITQEILKKVRNITSADTSGLIGIKTQVEDIESSLCAGWTDVCILGIWGMGGIGKTTVARALLDKISAHFEACCYLENIRENSEKHGLLHLRKKLLCQVLGENNLCMDISDQFFRDRLCRKKVLIVLDDIDDMEQIEKLAGKHDHWYGGPGSNIIITTRDRHVLEGAGIKVYRARGLEDEEALQLFNYHAFGKGPPLKGFEELSRKAIYYADGIPLALKVLGSCLSGKNIQTWASELAKLEKMPKKEIQNVLKVSFDGLDDMEKDILLDVVCFFKGKKVNFVKTILEAYDFFPDASLPVLIDKCLLYLKENGRLWMHDLIDEMGKEIVRQEDIKEPGRRSRLWDHKDISHMFKKNSGTEKVEGIFLDLSKLTKELKLGEEAFAKMHNLRLLKFFSQDDLVKSSKISLPRGLKMLPDDLRYLYWDGYPCKALPSIFDPENLILLYLRHSCIRQLYKGHMEFKHLKWMDLTYSQFLREVPDMSAAQNLENITLKGCTSISTIHPSIFTLSNLIDLDLTGLDLTGCINLQHLHGKITSKSLMTLIFSGCTNLQNIPTISDSMERIENLSLEGTAISSLPPSIVNLTGIMYLNLQNCKKLMSLPNSICKLECLQNLNLSGCENLDTKSIGLQLSRLSSFRQLWRLDLSYCNLVELPSFIDGLSSSSHLYLCGNNFERLPQSICNLRQLMVLDVMGCKRLRSLPALPGCLKELNAGGCTSLESIRSFESLSHKLRSLEAGRQIKQFSTFQEFNFCDCLNINEKNQYDILIEAMIQRVQALANIWHNKKGYR